MTRFTILAALSLVACSETRSDPARPGPAAKPGLAAATDVVVELAGATLGEDCGDSARPPPPPPAAPSTLAQARTEADARRAPPATADRVAEHDQSEAKCAGSGCRPPTGCEQTTMQLWLRTPAGPGPTTIRIKRVELLDAKGKPVGELAARQPSKWDDKGSYVTWDETVAPDQRLVASYALSSPDWNTITNGRWNAAGKTFTLRVTVVVGSSERTVERQALSPAMIEPQIET